MSNPVTEMLENSMKSIKTMVDANSVIGEPIRVDDNTLVVPVAKVSYGFGGGGTELVSRHKTDDKNFAGGIGGGTTVKAEAFLVISNGNVRIVPVSSTITAAEKIVDMVPGMVDKVGGFFAKKNSGDKKQNDNTER